jgi:regulatory protein
MMNRAKPAPSLKARALRLLAQREHSRLELERKLSPHETEPGTLAQALDWLQAKGFINETRVADSVVQRKAARMGTARIAQELTQKGLSQELVQNTVADLRSTEVERAHAVWARKFGQPASTLQARAKQLRFLAARGFAAEVVRRVVPPAVFNPTDDEDAL